MSEIQSDGLNVLRGAKAIGLSITTQPASPGGGEPMAMVRVSRADGRLFQLGEADVPDFLRDNPGSEVLPPRAPAPAPTLEDRATAAPIARPGFVFFDRGDGTLIQVSIADAESVEFKRANAGLNRVPARGEPPEATTAAEEAATVVAQEVAEAAVSHFASMTVADLRAYADEHAIDLTGASVKAEIVTRIEAASEGGPGEGK